MEIKKFISEIQKIDINHFIGIPDSTLKVFCAYLNNELREKIIHYTPANEGAAVAMATGIYLASQKVSCIYLQNSGIGNIYNPVASLTHQEIYKIPMLFVIGWRGEPGVKDEPQHVHQGKITLDTLELLGIQTYILSEETSDEEFKMIMTNLHEQLVYCTVDIQHIRLSSLRVRYYSRI